MAVLSRLEPKTTEVNRSELRQDQSAILKKAVREHVIVVRASSRDEEKYIVDKQYFDELLANLRSAIETLEITTDARLFSNLLKAADTIDEDLRLGKLHTFEEAFD
jgi:hypothetical protein